LSTGHPIGWRGVYLAAATKPEDSARPTFREIYDQEFGYVWHALRRLGTRGPDLEDAAHEVFVVIHRRLGDYDPARPLRPWLFGIAYRISSERRRSDAGSLGVAAREDVLELPDHAPSAEAMLAAEEARRRVHRALATLPLEQRAVMIMHDLEGHSAPQVAMALGVPLNTVYSRLRLAREKFVLAVRPDGERE
jgi:RNA polymerase sigma-70 factor, ECF subfamily